MDDILVDRETTRATQMRVALPIFLCLALSVIGTLPVYSQDSCGPVPALSNIGENTDDVKGNLQGQADILSKLVGKAQLSGEIEAAKRTIYQSTDKFFAAQKDAYLSYLFCVLIMRDTSLSTTEKINALEKYRNAPTPTNTGSTPPPHSAIPKSQEDQQAIQEVARARAQAQASAARGREAANNGASAARMADSAAQRALVAQRQAANNGNKNTNINGYIDYVESNGDFYQGEFRNGMRNGYGVQVWNNRRFYEGEFRDDRFDGYGSDIHSNGMSFRGLWRNQELYQGTVISGRSADTNLWEGEWDGGSDNHGYGVYRRGGYTFEGEFRDFCPCGYGIKTGPNGYRYEGQLLYGRPNGWGYRLSSGDEETGYFGDGTLLRSTATAAQ